MRAVTRNIFQITQMLKNANFLPFTMDKDLIRKIELYMERTTKDNLVKNYPLNREGHWRIMSGVRESGHRTILEIVHGKFGAAVAYAVQLPEFYGAWITDEDPSNRNNGKVERVHVRELKDEGLEYFVKNAYVKKKAIRK